MVDRWAGIPLCAALSVGHLVRRVLRGGMPPPPPRRILVILLSEMGSLVLAEPMFRRLRERHPAAEIHMMLFKRNRQLLDLLGVVDPAHVRTIRDDSLGNLLGDLWEALRWMWRTRFDAVVDCELVREMSVRVVRDRRGEERSAIQPLLRVAMEPDHGGCAGKPAQYRADAREELAVDHSIEPNRPHAPDRLPQVLDQVAKRVVADGDHMLRLHDPQQVQQLPVALEQHHVDLGRRVAVAKPPEHGLRQHQASHLAQEDHQNAPRRRRGHVSSNDPSNRMTHGQRRAERDARPSIDHLLESDIHACVRGFPRIPMLSFRAFRRPHSIRNETS